MAEGRAISAASLVFSQFLLLLLLLLLLFVFCPVNLVFSRATITSLPGFDGPLPFQLETGYIGVEASDVQLFYYFIKSTRNPEKDPVILWLTGGPGCTGLSGLLFEIGPLQLVYAKYNGSVPSMVLNPYSWTQVASIIFLDAPVGTGYSYARSSEGYKTGDLKQCNQTYQFLRKWLMKHPEFLSNSLYVGGDSYSGKTVPLVVLHISDGNKAGNKPFINIEGYMLGNPITDLKAESNMKISYAHGMGLISDEIYQAARENCGGNYTDVDPGNTLCLEAIEAYRNCISRINLPYTIEPLCRRPFPIEKPKHRRFLGDEHLKEFMSPKSSVLHDPPSPSPPFGCRDYIHLLSYYWANNPSVQRALHISLGSVEEWQRCNYDIPYEYAIQSSFGFHVQLSKRGYRSLIYNGDHDMVVPFSSTQAWIRALNYSIVDDWRPWFVDGQVGGYKRTYSNNMTFATVKGAGHIAPEHRPKECFAMFKRWISNEYL